MDCHVRILRSLLQTIYNHLIVVMLVCIPTYDYISRYLGKAIGVET